jgi:UDP-N-acetylglucosamine--N-acetylmuramyl-(pentapeptide) pyrophosphoryl-undecaprenol N-acetylglucosamine transferase
MSKGIILLCAGGTGGHLFPAEAVAHELKRRGYTIHLAADDRVERFADNFPAAEIHQIESATLGSKNPLAIWRTLKSLWGGYKQSRMLLAKIQPIAVAGFGGYPTVPPLLAAARLGIPTLVHEANAVLGRANRLLSKKVNKVALGFGETIHAGDTNVVVTGNPVRPDILKSAIQSYPQRTADAKFNLLVFGGSQGAAFFSEVLPQACRLLSENERQLLNIVQQARPEDSSALVQEYEAMNIKATVASFFNDMASEMQASHLVVCRAGASTVSELSVMGRPSILVPYPHALDHDQATNAAAVASEGGAMLFKQSALTPKLLADELSRAIADPKKLALAASNAKKTGKPDAAKVLANMLEALAV